MTQAAHTAAHQKDTYLAAHDHRLAVGGNELPGAAYGQLSPDGKLTQIVFFF